MFDILTSITNSCVICLSSGFGFSSPIALIAFDRSDVYRELCPVLVFDYCQPVGPKLMTTGCYRNTSMPMFFFYNFANWSYRLAWNMS